MTGEAPLSDTKDERPSADTGDESVVCPCAGVTVGTVRQALALDPQVGFDDLLARLGAGGKCTACLLDLEYQFVSLPRPAAPVAGRKIVAERERLPLKRRFYKVIDGLSPQMPMHLDNIMPVIASDGIDSWIWVVNRSMLFRGEECAPETDVELVVRNAAGAVVHRRTEALTPESSMRVDVGQYLEAPTGDRAAKPAIGSVEINRCSRSPGVRGTLRPQIEIIAKAGGCAVHSQAAGGPGERRFTSLCRPGEERVFLSLVNSSPAPMDVRLAYPVLDPARDDLPPLDRSERIPPFGARLHEIVLPDAYVEALADQLITLRWVASAPYKSHILCSSPNLDRFSIDHV